MEGIDVQGEAELKHLPRHRPGRGGGRPGVWPSPPSAPSTTHIVGPSLDLLVQLVLVLIPEWWVTHQQDIQDHPCGWGGEQHSPGGHQGQSSVSLCPSLPRGERHKQPLILAPSPPYFTREPGQSPLLYPRKRRSHLRSHFALWSDSPWSLYPGVHLLWAQTYNEHRQTNIMAWGALVNLVRA